MSSTHGRIAVLIPIYKLELSSIEEFSVEHSLALVKERDCYFVAPEGLDLGYYKKRWNWVRFVIFSAGNFTSVASYSRLLLSTDFYNQFISYNYVLILQPDAILFRDELDFWMEQGYFYVGAPWPEGIELTLWRDSFQGERRRRIRTFVGNGGLSLRHVRSCIQLIEEFPETHAAFVHSGTNEDSYYSLLGTQVDEFRIPSAIIASKFSMELNPEYYYDANGRCLPMGSHGWSIAPTNFWTEHYKYCKGYRDNVTK